ncbi:MAG: threonine dehydratase [Pelagimonas sp.]|nr:threonine dehydratase [Pelagimonas sp.]
MVLKNWKEAVQIGLVPMALAVGVAALIGWPILTDAQPLPEDGGEFGGLFARVFVMLVAFGLCVLWVVVNWHRFILKEEYPQGWIPPLHAKQLGGYFYHSILIALVMILPMILLGVLAVIPGIGFSLTVIGMGVLGVLVYRILPVLPAAAIGEPLGLGESWGATKGSFGALFVVVVLLFVLEAALTLPIYLIPTEFPVLQSVLDVTTSLISGLIGVSILTTLYGHYIEGRPLD